MSQQAESQRPLQDLAYAKSFIEVQLPVAKLSAESYKERKSNYSQTLTGLGKWWGRKPLVLVRATILGLLLPATDNPAKDREIYLKLMTMDEDGLKRRKRSNPSPLQFLLERQPRDVQERYIDFSSSVPSLKEGLFQEDWEEIKHLVWQRLSYSEKLEYCLRPEQVGELSSAEWEEINGHLGTSAQNLAELVDQLGYKRFGHRPKVGDAFAGGGSIPFEAARIGCDAYGSDLNPVAGLLTWAALNIVGGGEEVAQRVQTAREAIYEAVDRQITEWGIEHNEQGWRADAYLYCVEATDPESGWRVPLAPSWVIGEKSKTIAKLVPDEARKCYHIEIHSGVSDEEMKTAKAGGTVKDSALVPPNRGQSTPIQVIRRNLRMWEKSDIVPRPDDVFQERLYCIRWVETYYTLRQGGKTADLTKAEAEALPNFQALLDGGKLKAKARKHYRSPTETDLQREQTVLKLLQERFENWQTQGYIPSRAIEPGDETTRLQRERGWMYWHHLFNSRQLLVLGLMSEMLAQQSHGVLEAVGTLTSLGKSADWNARLSRWHPNAANEKSEQVFSNQALNTLYNYGVRPVPALETTFTSEVANESVVGSSSVTVGDARTVEPVCDLWITDPPYADAVNYHELTEFFLAWYEGHLKRLFPDWYTDSKRSLAIKGSEGDFRQAMVDCYKRLAEKMPDNGLQVVMFTHQDAGVWADLAMILWAAGLRVTAAWTIATETDSALKEGNYVQGTVLLVLRKRTESEAVFMHQLVPQIEFEVRRQLDEMTALEDASDPNFSDSDYQLAAYAAALRVLTAQPIEEIEPEKELLRARAKGEQNPLKGLIEQAVRIAADHQVPKGFDKDTWKRLLPLERFYLKGLELEAHGERRSGAYQELARGFGVADYDDLFAETKANQVRLMTPSELGRKYMQGTGFADTLLRQVLFAVYATVREEDPKAGLDYFKTELSNYWGQRERIMHLLRYLAAQRHNEKMPEWARDGGAADLLLGLVGNDYA